MKWYTKMWIISTILFLMSGLMVLSTTVDEKYNYLGQKAKPITIMEFNAWDKQIEWVGSNAVYVGESQSGLQFDSKGWRIKKIGYDGSDNPVNVTWANHSNEFDFKWDNRTTYNYSLS